MIHMSELSDIRKGLDELKEIVVKHIAETQVYRNMQAEVIKAHSKDLWGDGDPGIKMNVDRLMTIVENRKWTIRAIIAAVLAGITDRLFNIFGK